MCIRDRAGNQTLELSHGLRRVAKQLHPILHAQHVKCSPSPSQTVAGGLDAVHANVGVDKTPPQVVRRLQDGVFPLTIKRTYADGTTDMTAWDGQNRWEAIVDHGPSPIVRVEVDPDRTSAYGVPITAVADALSLPLTDSAKTSRRAARSTAPERSTAARVTLGGAMGAARAVEGADARAPFALRTGRLPGALLGQPA